MDQKFPVSSFATEPIFNYFPNASEFPTNNTLGDDYFEDPDVYSSETGRMVNVVCRPIIIVIGTVGNMLAFFVMRRGSLQKVSTCFYMSILALADTGKLLFDCFSMKNKRQANEF